MSLRLDLSSWYFSRHSGVYFAERCIECREEISNAVRAGMGGLKRCDGRCSGCMGWWEVWVCLVFVDGGREMYGDVQSS